MNIPEISPRERELAIFAVLAYSPAAYAIYVHQLLAQKVGFSPDQIEDALVGNLPKNLDVKV
jgi:alkylhydroperoxidase/carboxymuconolactone decarboxylase family protein YurZ